MFAYRTAPLHPVQALLSAHCLSVLLIRSLYCVTYLICIIVMPLPHPFLPSSYLSIFCLSVPSLSQCHSISYSLSPSSSGFPTDFFFFYPRVCRAPWLYRLNQTRSMGVPQTCQWMVLSGRTLSARFHDTYSCLHLYSHH